MVAGVAGKAESQETEHEGNDRQHSHNNHSNGPVGDGNWGWILDLLPDDLIRLQTLLGIYVRWVLANCRGEAAGHINGGGSVTVRGVQAHIVRCPGSDSTTTDCRGCTIINLIDSNDWLSVR